MITKWEDIANDPYFLDLPPIGQQEIRTRWFNKVVAPDFRNAGMDEDNLNVYRQRALETMLKSKDQAKAGYDAVLPSIQSSEDFTAPGLSPEQYKQSEEHQKANFIGKYADAPRSGLCSPYRQFSNKLHPLFLKDFSVLAAFTMIFNSRCERLSTRVV